MRNALRVRRGRGRSRLGITLLYLAIALGVLAATTEPAAATRSRRVGTTGKREVAL